MVALANTQYELYVAQERLNLLKLMRSKRDEFEEEEGAVQEDEEDDGEEWELDVEEDSNGEDEPPNEASIGCEKKRKQMLQYIQIKILN